MTSQALLQRITIRVGLCSILATSPAIAIENVAPPDVIVLHARVLTVDASFRVAQALAVRGDRIVAVGSDAEIEPLKGPETRVIDAAGKTVLPGLYDSHVHPLGAATSEADHELPVFDSLEAVMAYFADRAASQPKGTWIVAKYAFPTRLKEARFPTRAELDAIAPEHPVLHQAGPAGMVNSKALQVSGITRDSADPPAGKIVRDSNGEPTGLLRNAYAALAGLPSDAYAARGTETDAEYVQQLFRRYNERGITSVGDRGASDAALSVYRSLRDRGDLTVRVNATRILSVPPDADRDEVARAVRALAADDPRGEPNGPTGVGDHFLRIGPLKVMLDGGMLNGTAYMRTPWGVGPTYQITEPDYRGLMFLRPSTLSLVAEEAARRGWSMTAHIAGEAAMDELLAAYEHADRKIGIRGRRWMMTHANFASAENLALARVLGVGADLQPAWLYKDTRVLLSVLGPQRMEWFHPYRRWVDAGLVIGGGSDHMVRLDPLASTNPWDPWLGMHVAHTRQTESAGVFHPDEALTRREMLEFYTVWNARLHGEELEKGTLEPGKLADLIMIDRDPLSCDARDLPDVRVLWTMIGGRIVYSVD